MTSDRLPECVTDQMIADAIDSAFAVPDRHDLPFDSTLDRPPVREDFESDEEFEDAEANYQDDMEGLESVQAWFVLTWEVEGGDAD